MSLIAVPSGRPQPVRLKRPSERRSLSRSAVRALDVLECFGRERRRLRAVEIARMLELQGSTANQLLKSMVDSAHLVFDARSKTYFPSSRLSGFASLMTEAFGHGDRLRLLVAEVRERTGLSVTLSTPNGAFMQIVHIEMPAQQTTERGLRIGLFGSAIGSAYLASLADKEIARLAGQAGIADATLPELFDKAAQVRRDGYADGSGTDPSIWTIARLLPGGAAPMPLVLAVAGESKAVQDQAGQLRQMMLEAIEHWFDPAGYWTTSGGSIASGRAPGDRSAEDMA